MPQLIATAEGDRAVLDLSTVRTLGRDGALAFEPALSRDHAALSLDGGTLRVVKSPAARNPLFVGGRAVEEATLRPGESFVVGRTRFTFADEADHSPAVPASEVVFEPVRVGRESDRRLTVLAQLPELFGQLSVGREQDQRLASLLLAGVPAAETTAVVEVDGEAPLVMAWDRRSETAGEPRPSGRLVRDALARGRSILHAWPAAASGDTEYTQQADADWAVCTPIAGETRRVLYLAGRSGGTSESIAESLRTDVKFVDVLAEMLKAVRLGQRLEGRVAVLRQFFSPPVLRTLEAGDESMLEPRECDLCVLFADLRGFSGGVEAAGDLLGELERVRSALSVMTAAVLEHGGVTGEFLGDAVLGFWGWPIGGKTAAADACRAALAIREAFEGRGERVGVGIARGRAVAGRIVTGDRVSVNAFGPAVNLASRLQSTTKQLRVPVVVSEEVRREAESTLEGGRFRTLARVLPYGLETPLSVAELLPAGGLGDGLLRSFEEGIAAFTAGDWAAAYEKLHAMPPSDRAADFATALITRHDRQRPADWDGVVRLAKE